MPILTWQIISRGEIVHSGTLDMQNSQRKTHLISATLAMAPKAKLIVYAIYDNGKEKEVLADSIDLDINGIFQNMVTLCNVFKLFTSMAVIQVFSKIEFRFFCVI